MTELKMHRTCRILTQDNTRTSLTSIRNILH